MNHLLLLLGPEERRKNLQHLKQLVLWVLRMNRQLQQMQQVPSEIHMSLQHSQQVHWTEKDQSMS